MIIKVEGKTGGPFITEAKENLLSGKHDKEDHWLEKKNVVGIQGCVPS